MERILIVGAGAVGQVYARHLQQGGAHVAFYAKPKYEADLRAGTKLYWLNKGRPPTGEETLFQLNDIYTSVESLRGQEFTQVWLCIAADAVSADWFEPFAGAAGRDNGRTVLVSLQPGADAKGAVAGLWPEERLVRGMIGFISWQAPLKNSAQPQPAEPGLAYWFPPGSPSLFGGPAHRAKHVVALLRQGKCSAKYRKDTATLAARGSAVLMSFLVALEGADWSFQELRRGGWAGRAAKAAREALGVVCKHMGKKPPVWRGLLSGWSIRAIVVVARWGTPFDLEAYLAYHFTKVGKQTRQFVRRYEEMGLELGVPTPALSGLRAEVF